MQNVTMQSVVCFAQYANICKSNRFDIYQAAYQSGRSTETAVLNMTNNLLLKNDDHLVSAVGLVGISAAFHTIDHNIF